MKRRIKMQNAWLQAHLSTIDRMTKMLTEMEYMPIFQDYPVKTLQQLYRGAVAEISRLQLENETLKSELVKLTPKPDENPTVPKKDKKGIPGA